MATVQEAIRRLKIETTITGAEQAADGLNQVGSGLSGVKVGSEQTEKATLSLERSFASIERRYNATVRAQQEYDRIQRTVNAAVAQNPALQERANVVLAEAAERLARATGAANDNAAALQRQAAAAAQVAAVQARVNAVTGVTAASDTAARSADIAAYGRQLDDLRAKYNPLFAAGRAYRVSLDEINHAARVGALSEAERAAALTRTKAAFAEQVAALKASASANDNVARSVGLTRHELINLSRQAQDVTVSLASGMSPMTVILQQGSQIVDVFASSQGSVGGFFAQVTGWLRNFLTIGRVAFGGVTAAVTAGLFALNGYLDAQQKVSLALTGAGRASGATAAGINAIAGSASSVFGLSVSEAREMASALVATGKVANDNILPIVQMGKDIATVYGIDAAEASRLLARAFADPARGAEMLNERLGMLDAATMRQITNLKEQNRLQEAQRLLMDATKSGLDGVSDSVAVTTKFWTALGNAISNAWDKLGEYMQLATGIGKTTGLEQQLAEAQKLVDVLSKAPKASLFGFFEMEIPVTEKDRENLRKAQQEVDRLTEAIKRNAAATDEARQRQQSFAQAEAVSRQLPELAQLKQLRSQQEMLTRLMADVEASGGPASDILKRMGRSYEELAKAVELATLNVKTFRSDFRAQLDQLKLANDAIGAVSAGAKAQIAYRQSMDASLGSSMTEGERKQLAEQAYANAIKQSSVALTEQARARELYARQAVAAAQLDVDMIGKSVGQQAELRANLQARQQLEQQAAQNRTAFDEAEYQRLKRINAEYGKRVQQAAEAHLKSDIKFDFDTALLSDADRQIASILRQVYGPEWQNMMDGPIAGAMRWNETLRDINGTVRDVAKGFATDIVSGLMQGKSDADTMIAALDNISNKLANKAVSDLFSGDPTKMALAPIEFGVAWLAGEASKAKKAKKEFEEAQAAWAAMAGEYSRFTARLDGRVEGALSKGIGDITAEAQKYADAAHKAGVATDDLQRKLTDYATKQVQQFIGTFSLLIESLDAGLGPDGAAVKAAQSVKGVADQLLGVVSDVKSFAPGSAAQSAAEKSSQGYLLSMLQTAPVLSEVQTRILEIKGAAAQLSLSLKDLGMSAAQAASAISDGVGAALDALSGTFSAGIRAEINAASGKSYLNDVQSLLDQAKVKFIDAQNLGVDPALIGRWFAVQAQEIVNGADLAGSAFDELIALFPQLSGVVVEANSALSKQVAEQQKYRDQLRKTINEFVLSINLGQLSAVSPQQQLALAKQNYEQQLALARSGDTAALSGITEAARTYIEQAKSYYASSQTFAAISSDVIAALQALPSQASLDPVVAAINQSNVTLKSIETLQALTKGISTSIEYATRLTGDQSQQLATWQGTTYFAPMVNYLAQIQANTKLSGQAAQAPKDEFKWWNPFTWFEQGGVVPSIRGAYEPGGIVGNGLWGRDSVLASYAGGGHIALAGAEGILTAPATQAIGGAAMIDYINRNRRLPGGEGASLDWRPLALAIKQALDISDERMIAKLDQLLDALDAQPARTKDALRQIVATAKPRAA